ncbi:MULTISPECIES: hypothetical protein [unclassified Rhodococcus (in: high G+C Gram-positive bacteria)]|uniref:hypothetical protein n=1 Tax=Rhodococcus sp. SJ-3 TaxID=3454628 RepID=UPI003F7B0C10
MHSDPSTPSPYRNGAGSTALVAGIAAVVFAIVPIVGDLVTVPAGLVAVVCGWIGMMRVEKGVADNQRDALIGAVLGITGLFVVFLVFVATHSAGR